MAVIARRMIGGLSTLVSEAGVSEAGGSQADGAVIFLHGWGSEGSDLMGLVPFFEESLPHSIKEVRFYAPDGPEACSANPLGRQWFSLEGDQASMDRGVAEAMPYISGFIEAVMGETGLGFEQIWLFGFSQGGMVALHAGLRLAGVLGGVMSFSGALLAPSALADEVRVRPRVLLVHGAADEVVPFQAMGVAEAVLSGAGVRVESLACEGLGHSIDRVGLERALAFMGGRGAD